MKMDERQMSPRQRAIAEADNLLRKAGCRWDGRSVEEPVAPGGDMFFHTVKIPMGGAVKPRKTH